MQWTYSFDFAALVMCIMIYIIYKGDIKFPSFTNRIYFHILNVAMASTILEMLCSVIEYFEPPHKSLLLTVSNMACLSVFNCIPLFYLIYIMSISNVNVKNFKAIHFRFFIPYALELLLIFTTPLTKFVFYVTEDNHYVHNSGFYLLYLAAAYYIIASSIWTHRSLNKFNSLQKISIYFYMISIITIALMQLLFPNLLITNFAVALSLYCILLSLENPYEYKDFQTNAFNREAFVRVVDESIAYSKKITILSVSVEGFKFINEKFGLQNGNELLKQVCEYLYEISPKNSLFHITGTQFCLLLNGEDSNDELILKIRDRFEQPYYVNDIEVRLWMYMCCLIYPDNVKSLNDVLNAIDYALNEARNSSSNVVIYSSGEILSKRQREHAVLSAINKAINNESFEIFFQPIYSVPTDSYTNAEALIRLKDDELGYISPDEFIPMAEKNGSIIQIGEIIFKKACQFLAEDIIPNRDRYSFNCIHINLSVIQCMQTDLVHKFFTIMEQYNIPSEMINLEITETVAANSGERLYEVMRSFEDGGVHFSLDDYGTGYSNMANIMRYRYSIIKLDKSLLWTAYEGPQAMALLKNTVSMMQDLNMEVLMEGVETEEQIELLKSLGVTYFQGFYYSEPLNIQEFLEFIK